MKRALTALALVAACTPADDLPPPPTTTTTTAPPAPPETTTTVVPLRAPDLPPVRVSSPPSTVPPTVGAAAADVAPIGGDMGTADVVAAICAAWGDECGRAVRVARCESGLRPGARSGRHAGLFQVATDVHAARIAWMGYTPAQMLEVGPNIAVAHALWVEQGWRPWTCAA